LLIVEFPRFCCYKNFVDSNKLMKSEKNLLLLWFCC
jgi:hypothetical protein